MNFCFFCFKTKEMKKISFTILLSSKVSKTVLFFGRIFLFAALFPSPNKTADSKIPQSALACPSIFSQLYLRKIKILALKSLCVGLFKLYFSGYYDGILKFHVKIKYYQMRWNVRKLFGLFAKRFEQSDWWYADFSEILRSLDFFVTFCIKTKSFIKKLELLFFCFKAKEMKKKFKLW